MSTCKESDENLCEGLNNLPEKENKKINGGYGAFFVCRAAQRDKTGMKSKIYELIELSLIIS